MEEVKGVSQKYPKTDKHEKKIEPKMKEWKN